MPKGEEECETDASLIAAILNIFSTCNYMGGGFKKYNCTYRNYLSTSDNITGFEHTKH
jgi:hypothetical protein